MIFTVSEAMHITDSIDFAYHNPRQRTIIITIKIRITSMESESIRHFREVNLDPGANLEIRSLRTGKPVKISLKKLNNYQRETLSNTCDVIQEKLKGTEFEKSVQALMCLTAFLVTSSRHVNGYSVKLNEAPLIILNSKTFTGRTDEFRVTVLHELLHFMEVSDDRDPLSLEEAIHDVLCYKLLGVSIPPHHWAWTIYPDLKDEILSNADVIKRDMSSSQH